MYLKTTQRKNKNGSIVKYYHLAHNERDPDSGVPTPKVLHTFGRADELDRNALVRLCRSIGRVCGVQILDPCDIGEDATGREPGLPRDVRWIRSRELGTPWVIEALWERLGIGTVLRDITRKRGCHVPYERALLAITANRMCTPDSKLGVWDRWLKKVHMPSCSSLKLDQMYEAMDLLHECSGEVEEHVFFQTSNLFNLEVDVVFYDTTTASFAIDYEDEGEEGFRKFGKSKEGTWSPQIVVALAVTREGLPIRSWVFPGNQSDVKTVEQVKKDLKGWKLGRALFVADSGMNSEESRRELAKACGKYLLATRMGSVKEIKEKVLSKPGRYRVIHENLHAKEVWVGDGVLARRYILCYNPKEAERQRKHRELVIETLRTELAKHPEKKATAQWAVELKASRRFGRYLRITGKGAIEINEVKVREAKRYDGKWVIQTNDDTLTPEAAACGYKALLVIERCFRSLKRTRIKMTPMNHWLIRRIEAHVKICVLALLLERVAELACNKTWPQIQEVLSGLQAAEYETNEHHFFERNHPASDLRALLKKLGIPLPKRVLGISPRN